ncbi:MAG: LysR family transcriptional regulator [Parvularculaceae bacterium]|nr:LysR family transcriptional regulator [Parvularculaceae bacterium]
MFLPTLRQLQFFAALARRRSFSKAAEDCLVSQSTLSSAVKELESLLAAELVDRSTRSFALTPAGEETARRAGPILAMAEDLVRAVGARRPLEGPFALGVIPTIAPFFLPGASALLRKDYPKLQLFLREDLTENLVERLAAGLLDAALLAFPYDAPQLEHVEIGEDRFWLAAPRAHRLAARKTVSLADLEGERMLLLEDGHCLREHAIDACRLRSKEAAAGFGATSLFTLVQMAEAGLGPTLLPEMAVRSGLARASDVALIPFAAPAPSRKIGLAWRRGSGRREEAEAMAKVFKAALAAA